MSLNQIYTHSNDSLIQVYAGESIGRVKTNEREKQKYKGKKHKKEDKDKDMSSNQASAGSIDIRC